MAAGRLHNGAIARGTDREHVSDFQKGSFSVGGGGGGGVCQFSCRQRFYRLKAPTGWLQRARAARRARGLSLGVMSLRAGRLAPGETKVAAAAASGLRARAAQGVR